MGSLLFKLQLLTMVCIICSASIIGFGFATSCKEVERNALLKLKHSFNDPFNLLGSWVGEDCCKWEGVACDNLTSNVFKLDLGPKASDFIFEIFLAAGEVNPALLELKYLTYLDLSSIDFNGSTIPKFLGSMTQLQHLHLFDCNFSGEIPQNLGNLTQLIFLDLSACYGCYSNNLEWTSKLQNLQYLDLSWVDLNQTTDIAVLKLLPSLLSLKLEGCQLGNTIQVMRNLSISSSLLQDLDFSDNSFSGSFPSFIQNLSSIRSLDLSDNQLSSPIPSWLGNNLNLKDLNLKDNLFTGPFPAFIQNLSSIESIDLSYNSFNSSLPTWMASKKLQYLDLGHNSFSGPFPQFLQNSSSLITIDLSSNHFSLSIPSWLADKRELDYVDLSNNQFDRVDGGIMNTLSRFCNLINLNLSHNSIQEEVSETQANSSRCATFSLSYLSLSNNNIGGHLPIIQTFTSLIGLDVSQNNLETIPFLGLLPYLNYLILSHNHLSVVHQASLANLSSLNYLDISSNPSPLLDISPDWIPPFQLIILDISYCNLNGLFPKWLLSQTHLIELDLSDTGIFGPLPDNIGNEMIYLQILRLANNRINGSIPNSLCNSTKLTILDLRNNWLSGMIPDCLENSQSLEVVELSSNTLFGPVPNSLTKVPYLQLLSLSNNSLDGELPEFTSTYEKLAVLDVGWNNLNGKIPPWNGANFPSLQVLILRENRYEGEIPPQLCSVRTLQVIDLAKNDLVGTIPQCFGYFQGMRSAQHPNDFSALPSSSIDSNISYEIASEPTVSPDEWSAMEVLKGVEREYTSVLHLLVNIDLSCNSLEGVIPTNLTCLTLLIGLNLSHNHLNGELPKEIGNMMELESLDLSSNNLSGPIPESISSLHSLSKLNLSFNNLQGQIPTGSQLQVLSDPASIYMGNPGLCGDPLPKLCFGSGIAHPPTSMDVEEEDEHEKMLFYMFIVLGFACGFWGVIGTLIVKKRWRHVYFGFAEEIGDWLYVRFALVMARAKRRLMNVI